MRERRGGKEGGTKNPTKEMADSLVQSAILGKVLEMFKGIRLFKCVIG